MKANENMQTFKPQPDPMEPLLQAMQYQKKQLEVLIELQMRTNALLENIQAAAEKSSGHPPNTQ